MIRFPEIVHPLVLDARTSSADRSTRGTTRFLAPVARPAPADEVPSPPTTATHRAQRTRGRLPDHVWSATMDAGRSAAQPHARRSVNDGHAGNNDVQRAARARRGSSGRSPAGRRGPDQPPSRASSRARRARAVGWLPHHTEVGWWTAARLSAGASRRGPRAAVVPSSAWAATRTVVRVLRARYGTC